MILLKWWKKSEKKDMKVVIDTNIWISFLLGKLLSNLVTLILNNNINIVTSKEQIAELLDVVNKPKLKKYISNYDLQKLYYFITKYSEFVELENTVKVCRDPKDNYLIEIAQKGNADFLVTGDNDLLELNPYNQTKIITYAGFKIILEKFQ